MILLLQNKAEWINLNLSTMLQKLRLIIVGFSIPLKQRKKLVHLGYLIEKSSKARDRIKVLSKLRKEVSEKLLKFKLEAAAARAEKKINY
jgi:hypothetical protein